MTGRALKIIAIFFFIGLAHQTMAQEFAFGLKGGLNLTNLKVDNPEASYNSRTGYHAGIFLRGKFDRVAIQPEVLLFTQSNKVTYSGLLGSGSMEESFTYLSVPVIIKFYPIAGLNIQVGPQFGFLLDGEQKYNSTFFTGTRDIKDYYKNSDVSVSVGGGYDFGFGLNMDVRYNVGVKDINNEANGDAAKSRVFLVSLGWNFIRQ
jgi:hypothetical protein